MNLLNAIDIQSKNKEEILPKFSEDFPYLASRAELDSYLPLGVPWHWHRTLELFIVESGCVEYTTPQGKWVFPAGSGGLVNANVLHSTSVRPADGPNIQLLHLFDPAFLSGGHGSRMERKYILPITATSSLEVLPLFPEERLQREILEEIRLAFAISEEDWGYEFRLRDALSKIWLKLFALARPILEQTRHTGKSDDLMKALMVYIHENYPQPLSVDQLAASVNISKRVCFRLFQDNLRMTPLAYIQNYRLQKACQLLTETNLPITQVAYSCSLGSSSYYGKTFREQLGCTPGQYRQHWHDRDIK